VVKDAQTAGQDAVEPKEAKAQVKVLGNCLLARQRNRL